MGMPCIYYLSYPNVLDLLFKLSLMRGYLCYPKGVDLFANDFVMQSKLFQWPGYVI